MTAFPPLTNFLSVKRTMGLHLMAAVVLSTAVVGGLPGSAWAEAGQDKCGQRDRMVEHLKATYGEIRRGGGLQSATGLMELYVSSEGSWTLLLTRPDGTSCPVAVGEAWRNDGTPFPKGEKPA